MHIVLIHGDDTRKAEERFTQIIRAIKKRSWEVVRINAPRDSLIESINMPSLFGAEILYVVDEPQKLSKEELEWLRKNEKDREGRLLLYRKGQAGNLTRSLPKSTEIEKFDLPKVIFQFLERFFPGNKHEALYLLSNLKESGESLEFVLALLTRQLRDIYLYKLGDFSSLPAWKKNKLSFQASKFTEEKLKKIIEDLAQADIESKTGGVNLSISLDLVIARELE